MWKKIFLVSMYVHRYISHTYIYIYNYLAHLHSKWARNVIGDKCCVILTFFDTHKVAFYMLFFTIQKVLIRHDFWGDMITIWVAVLNFTERFMIFLIFHNFCNFFGISEQFWLQRWTNSIYIYCLNLWSRKSGFGSNCINFSKNQKNINLS